MMNSEIGFGRKVLQVFEDNNLSFEHMPSGVDTMTVFVHQSEFEHKEQQVISGIHRAVHPDLLDLDPSGTDCGCRSGYERYAWCGK